MLLICIVELESPTNCLRVTAGARSPCLKHSVEVNLEYYPAKIKEQCLCRPGVAALGVVHVRTLAWVPVDLALATNQGPRRVAAGAIAVASRVL